MRGYTSLSTSSNIGTLPRFDDGNVKLFPVMADRAVHLLRQKRAARRQQAGHLGAVECRVAFEDDIELRLVERQRVDLRETHRCDADTPPRKPLSCQLEFLRVLSRGHTRGPCLAHLEQTLTAAGTACSTSSATTDSRRSSNSATGKSNGRLYWRAWV